MQVEVAERPPMRIAYLTHVGPHTSVRPTFERLYAWASPRGLTGPHAVGVAVYLDDTGNTARTECAVSVADDVVAEDEVKVRTLAGGRYAVIRLSGTYARLSESYAALFAWLEAGGGTRGEGPIVEVYLNDPHDTAPANLETEIRLPLA
jgi:AraC family transcriptional regulator